MEKSLLKLKCRRCESIINVTNDEEKSCNCGNCTLRIKDGRVYISSKTGLGDYILFNGDDEYILISKKELEENNG